MPKCASECAERLVPRDSNDPGDFSRGVNVPISENVMAETQPLVVRERALSNAAAHHLLSKEGSSAGLAAAMSSDVKRIRAGLDARVRADIVAVGANGSITIFEAKQVRNPKKGFFTIVWNVFGKDKQDDGSQD